MKARGKYVDAKHRGSITNSSNVVGQLYPVLRDAEGARAHGILTANQSHQSQTFLYAHVKNFLLALCASVLMQCTHA